MEISIGNGIPKKWAQISRLENNNNNKNPEVIQRLKLAEEIVIRLQPAGIAQK